MQGKIHRLIRGKGFGFILVEEQQYFFHHSEVRDLEFRRLGVGDTVEFQVADAGVEGKNPRAVEVHLVAKAEPPPLPPAAPPAPAAAPPPRPARRPAGRPQRPRRPQAAEDNFGSGLFQEGGPAEDLEFSSDVEASESIDSGSPADRALDGVEMLDSGAGSDGAFGSSGQGGARRERQPFRGGRGGAPHGGQRGVRGPQGRSRGGPRHGRQRDPRPQRPRATGVPGERGEGVVRSLNAERGFGFIETATGDLFFHRSHVREDFGTINIGSRVAFVFGEGDRGAQAQDVSVV
jgi:cold shock CspA family protein